MHTVALHSLGILLALSSAAVLTFGNIWQSRGVAKATKLAGDKSFFLQLVKTPIWLLGTLMFGLAIVLQMGSLAFAPLMLVQPIGVLALVFAVFLNAKLAHRKPSPQVVKAVIITLVGVGAYVIIAAQVSEQKPITDGQLVAVLWTLAGALVLAGAVRLLSKKASAHSPILYVLLGGVFSAFVATLGKTVILRVQALFQGHHFSLDHGGALTLICVLGIGVASALSIYFVQTAYTCNPSDVVVAGLTVIDPAIAVLLGIVILQEAASAPLWSLIAIAVAGAVAVYGVLGLSKAEEAQAKIDASDTAADAADAADAA